MTKGDTTTHIDAMHVAVQRGVSTRVASPIEETYWTVREAAPPGNGKYRE